MCLQSGSHLIVERVSALQHARVLLTHVFVADDARVLHVELQSKLKVRQFSPWKAINEFIEHPIKNISWLKQEHWFKEKKKSYKLDKVNSGWKSFSGNCFCGKFPYNHAYFKFY